MNILRPTLITLLVAIVAIGALRIPLKSPVAVIEQPRTATGATISLIDSINSLPGQPAVIEKKEQLPTSKPLPSKEDSFVVQPVEKPAPKESKAIGEAEQSEQETPIPEALLRESQVSNAASALASNPQPSLINGYYREESVDQGPVFDRKELASKIHYPPLAKRQGVEGLVVLRLSISSTGKVEEIEVEEDPGYGMAQAAVKAFTGLQGTPAILGGEAVAVLLRYPVRFSLR